MATKSALARQKGKKYAAAAVKVEERPYSVDEAMALLPELSTSSFDGTAEVHIRINADPRQADQLVRTTVSPPHGTGKTMRIAAFVKDDMVADAKKAGAVLAGNEDLIAEIEAGNINFDVAVADPSVMKSLGKVAKTLGQKGLMPNPKAGTVTPDVVKTIGELQKGRLDLKMDKQAIIHTVFGKMSFGPAKLTDNFNAIMDALNEAKPSGIKGNYINSVFVTPSMGPGIRITINN
jgi:large subunit ribosomal protein L1